MTTEANPDPDLPYFEAEPYALADFATAEQRYVQHVELPVSPETLFEIFEDEHSWTRWALGITNVEWTTPKPFGVGTTRTVTFANGTKVFEKFIAWETGKHMAFTLTGLTEPIWSRFAENYEVKDLGQNRSSFTWTVAYEPRDRFAQIHFLIRPFMGMAFRYYLRRLEKHAAGWQSAGAESGAARAA